MPGKSTFIESLPDVVAEIKRFSLNRAIEGDSTPRYEEVWIFRLLSAIVASG